MFKKDILCIVFIFMVAAAFPQGKDPVIVSYQRNFVRASISTKIELVNDASRITTVNMTPLYIDAISFVLKNYELLDNDTQLLDIAALSATNIGAYQDPAAITTLQNLFAAIPEPRVQIAALRSLAKIIKTDKDKVLFINDWFSSAIDSTLKGDPEDVQVMVTTAQILGDIGHSSSFPVLFTAATGKLDTAVVKEAEKSLNKITENYSANILAIITDKSIQDVYAAFSFAMKRQSLSETELGTIAEAAFTRAIAYGQSNKKDDVYNKLVKDSLSVLGKTGWSKASPTVVQYFYNVQGEYHSDKADVDRLIPVIECLGGLGTTEAAQALSIFLGLLNSQTEQKKTYNEQVLLSVIHSLGALGDKSAFDYLLYVGYLDYPETVKQAARDALARLKW